MNDLFKKIKPEEAGIPSEAILRFIKQLEDNKVNIHSFLISYETKILAEAYWKPFNKDFQHRMYSAGKSFVSVAIGLLQDEGKLKINDYICDYFKEKVHKNAVHEYIKKITIKDMLTMRTAHVKTTYKVENSDDWVGSFFRVKPTHYPGTIFSYDTSASLVLSALVEKLSGKSLMDYLREKVLDYVDFSKEAKFLPDPMGVSQGGSGLICTMRDLAKFSYLCMNNGYYNGKQLIPKEYLMEATSKQVDTSIRSVIDEQQGYGFQFWRSRNAGFTLFGMGGQLAVCLPNEKFMLITTADIQGDPTGVQGIYEAFWQQVYPYIERKNNKSSENIKTNNELMEKINSLSIKPMDCKIESSYKEKINGKKYILDDNKMDLKYFKIIFNDNVNLIEYENAKGKFIVPFSFNKFSSFSEESINIPMIISASWKTDNLLYLKVNLLGELLGSIKAAIGFNGNHISILMEKNIEGILDNYNGIATGKLEYYS